MPNRCASCERSLATMPVYRRRGETYRPGSIMPFTPRHLRGRSVLCEDCYRELAPGKKRDFALKESGDPHGRRS